MQLSSSQPLSQIRKEPIVELCTQNAIVCTSALRPEQRFLFSVACCGREEEMFPRSTALMIANPS